MKYFYAILFFIVLSYAENIAEFCVTFSKDCNKYNLHLINKIVIEPDTNWIYPDSVCCGYTNCEVRWNSSFSLQSPRRTPAVVNGDWYRSPRGYLSGFHICHHCDSCGNAFACVEQGTPEGTGYILPVKYQTDWAYAYYLCRRF